MNLTTRFITITGILFCISTITFSQKFKFGQVTQELMQLTECDFHKNADAMVTYKSGKRDVIYNDRSIKAVLNQKIQVKIFNNESKDAGNFTFYYYSPAKSSVGIRIRKLTGKTYVLEDGVIKEYKLAEESIFDVQFNNNTKKITAVLPNITKNCVFEIEYEIESDYYSNIEDWDIQEQYPVLYNEFESSSPDYFVYQINILGNINPVKDNKSTGNTLNFKGETRTFVFENIPPYVLEPFMANLKDNRARITHRLVTVQVPGYFSNEYDRTYLEVSNSLLQSTTFGKKIKNGDFIEKLIDVSDKPGQVAIGERVHNYFVQNVKWDGYNHFRTEKSGKNLLKEGKGDAGDINLNYIAALNQLGVKTFPVILSTLGNGTLHPFYPDYGSFDYVVALSLIDDKLFFSDATSKVPFGNLPLRCLNGKGWIVDKEASDWISLTTDKLGKQIVQSEITTQNNVLTYKTKLQRSGYFAYADQEELTNTSEEDFLKSISGESELKVDTIKLLENSPNVIKLREVLSMDVNSDEFIYINPFIHLPYKSNPFTRDERISLIDFPFAEDYKFVTIISLNEGYTYEAPPNMNIVLDENSILLKYTTVYNPEVKKLTIVADLKILKTNYLPEEYGELKKVFEVIVNKLNEPIVLKKV